MAAKGEGRREKAAEDTVVRWERFLPKMMLRVLLVESDDSTRQIIAALLRKCSYKGKENLCLYGLSTGKWEVHAPAEEVSPELPEPALGINYARGAMDRKEWLCIATVGYSLSLLILLSVIDSRKMIGK